MSLEPALSPESHLAAARSGRIATIAGGTKPMLAVAVDATAQAHLADALARAPAIRSRIIGTTPDQLTGLYVNDPHLRLVERTRDCLHAAKPELSAKNVVTLWQALVLAIAAITLIAGFTLASGAFLIGSMIALSVVFLLGNALRLIAAVKAVPGSQPWMQLADNDLPIYTVLVPLFREAEVVADLAAALERLDYPRDKLDIKLLLEADDRETRAAVDMLQLPPHYSVLVLPPGYPRTKPKALSVGLELARGVLTCVYDAEDRPEPEQLRQAAGAFALAPPSLACLQARLAYRNWSQNLMTRQFAIEYAVQFDVLNPLIAWLGLPMPLGGTSNHFRTAALRNVGGWDPYNVTEDADIGVRLARAGWQTGVIDSSTYEEAPPSLGAWLKQRTRWMKGWLQTALVHTRNPLLLVADLGPLGVYGFVATVIVNLLSAAVHPLAIGLVAYHLSTGELFASESVWSAAVSSLAAANLIFGYAMAFVAAAVALYRRPMQGLSLHLMAMPVYWTLTAVAFVLAIVDLIRQPHFWAKTEHGKAERDVPAPLKHKRAAGSRRRRAITKPREAA